jgi:hypothetical protein
MRRISKIDRQSKQGTDRLNQDLSLIPPLYETTPVELAQSRSSSHGNDEDLSVGRIDSAPLATKSYQRVKPVEIKTITPSKKVIELPEQKRTRMSTVLATRKEQSVQQNKNKKFLASQEFISIAFKDKSYNSTFYRTGNSKIKEFFARGPVGQVKAERNFDI